MPASRFSTQLIYGKETTPGVVPATPTLNILRTTGPLSITTDKESFESEEVFAHRQTANVRHGRRSVGGSVPVELSYAAYKDWMEALLGGTWEANAAGTPNLLKVGTNMQTFFLERQFANISQYEVLKGVTPSGFSLDVNPDGIVTGSFDVMGMDFDDMSPTSLGVGTDVATNQPFDGLGNATVTEGGSVIDIVTSLSLSVETDKATGGLVGSAGTKVAANGKLKVSGTLTAQLLDNALTTKFFNETESSLSIEFADLNNAAQTLKIDIPRIKYMSNSKSENNNEVAVALDFTGLYDATDSSSIILTDSNPA